MLSVYMLIHGCIGWTLDGGVGEMRNILRFGASLPARTFLADCIGMYWLSMRIKGVLI